MAFEVKGTLKKLFDQQDFPSGFYKRDFVITTMEQYPQDIKFSALKEKSEQLGQFSEGDVLNVKFDPAWSRIQRPVLRRFERVAHRAWGPNRRR